MGCFESFTARVKCEFCGHEFEDDNIQSKDFGKMLDHLKQGEDTRKMEPSSWLYKDSMFNDNPKMKGWHITIDRALELCEKYPKKYQMRIRFDDDGERHVELYRYGGVRKTTFFGIKDKRFHCYTSCKKCKEWLDLVGVIEDYRFLGIEPILMGGSKSPWM